MHRTTIMLPRELKRRAAEEARLRRISLSEFMRRAVEAAVSQNGGRREDSLLLDDRAFSGKTPRDLSTRHDDYLYGKHRLR